MTRQPTDDHQILRGSKQKKRGKKSLSSQWLEKKYKIKINKAPLQNIFCKRLERKRKDGKPMILSPCGHLDNSNLRKVHIYTFYLNSHSICSSVSKSRSACISSEVCCSVV